MVNKVLRNFHDFSSKNRQNFLSNFARCESLLTSSVFFASIYVSPQITKIEKKLHMFLFIGDVTSVQCITSVLNNTKAGRLLSLSRIFVWLSRLVRQVSPSVREKSDSRQRWISRPPVIRVTAVPLSTSKNPKILIFKPNFKSILGPKK